MGARLRSCRSIAAVAVVVIVVAACAEGPRSELDPSLARDEVPSTTSTTGDPVTTTTGAAPTTSTSPPSTTSSSITTTTTSTATTTSPGPTTTSGRSGPVTVFDLDVGLCFDDSPDEQVDTVPAVPCGEPHDNEVFHLFDLADGPYPGDETVDLAASDGCTAAFPDYVDRDYETSALFLVYLTPSSQTWSTGDREVVCFLYLPDEKLTASMRGSGL